MKQERGGNTGFETMNKLKQGCKDSDKFDRKIIGKQFLVGKYFDGGKDKKIKKDRKYTKSKIQKLLNTQQKIVNKQISYAFYQPLHELWKAYITDLIKNDKTEDTINLKLMRADYHGALITVVHSCIDSYIGLQGVIINQSLKTFKIITSESRVLTLLKNQIIFQCQVMERYYVINGNSLIFRPTDRAKIKFKSRKPEKMNLKFLQNFMKESREQGQK